MKRIAFGPSVSIAAFIIGICLAWTSSNFKSEQSAEAAYDPILPAATNVNSLAPEFTNVSLPHGLDFIDLLPLYKGKSSVSKLAKERGLNKSWLGVFKRRHQYSLERRSATFGKLVKDFRGDFYPVRFKDGEKALFLISDEDGIVPGTVTTLYEGPSDEEIEALNLPFGEMELGFRREFQIGGEKYILRVAPGVSDNGLPISVLVLENGVKSQIVWYKQSHENSTPSAGDLDWVGDLDGDSKLDFKISSFASNGGYKESFLFLSSKALPENLVAPYAYFSARMH